MTEAELFAAMTEAGNLISQDFEFFITLTFAVIIVAFTIGEKLTLYLRTVISILYMAAVALFLFRYQYTQEVFTVINSSLLEMNSKLLVGNSFGSYATILRWLVYVLGSLATVYAVFKPVIVDGSSEKNGKE